MLIYFPHPGPLPRGEGEFGTAARRLPGRGSLPSPSGSGAGDEGYRAALSSTAPFKITRPTAMKPKSPTARSLALILALCAVSLAWAEGAKPPVLIGLDAEFGLDNSISAQQIEKGIRIALAEINGAGGVLGGRPLELVTKDHRSMPARGIKNLKEFAAMPELVAVFGGRFSPVVIEELPTIRETRVPFLVPWAAADPIIDNGMNPNYAFRLSLRDSLAMRKMLEAAKARGLDKVGLLLTNTAWGRSNAAGAEKYAAANETPKIVRTAWYNWRDTTLLAPYESLLDAGAKAVILVANDDEAARLVREVAPLPAERRVPILSHWGVTGGEFVEQAGPALQQVDFTVIQTFSLFQADPKRLRRFIAAAKPLYGWEKPDDIVAPVGVAHAYDLTHILARAIDLAGSSERAKVRDALERVRDHRGMIKHYPQPFTRERHEALGPNELLMTRYRADGMLVPVETRP